MMARLLAMAMLLLAATGVVRGVGGVAGLPPLQGDQLETLRTEPGPAEEYQSRAFGPLLINVREWTLTMKKWSADQTLADGWATVETMVRFTEDPEVHAGEAVSLFGRFRERQTLGGQYTGVERWLIELADRERPEAPMGPVIVLFVETSASAITTPPEDGWFVAAAGRFYKPMRLPERTTGQQRIFPAFVGAVFHVSPARGGPPSNVFVWVALTIAVMISVGVTVVFILIKKHGPVRHPMVSPTPAAGLDAPMMGDTPEEAMARLREGARDEKEKRDDG